MQTTLHQARRYWPDLLILALLALTTAIWLHYLSTMIRPVAYDWITEDAWFDADLPRVYANMTDRFSDHYRTNAHPLFSLFVFPPVKVLTSLFGLEAVTAVRVVLAGAAGLWMALLFILLRLATGRRLDAVLFCLIAAASASAFFWLTVPETYVFGSITLILALLFAAVVDRQSSLTPGQIRLNLWATVISALTLSMTLTNWIAGIVVTFLSFPWKRALQITLNALVIVVLLWSLQKVSFPSAGFFLGDLSEDSQFLLVERSGGPLAVARSAFLHTMSMPEPVQFPRHREVPPFPTLMLTQPARAGSGSVWGALAVMAWVGLLGLGLKGLVETKRYRTLRLSLLLILAGQLLLHLVYGSETFIYSLHFLPLLVLLAAMGTWASERPVALVLAILLVITAGINNYQQFRDAAAFFDNPVAVIEAPESYVLPIGEENPSGRQRVLDEMMRRPEDPWPRGSGHVILAIPGSREIDKGYYEPGGSFSPAVGSFGISFWVLDGNGHLLTTSDDLPANRVEQGLVWPESASGPGIQAVTPFYEATWLPITSDQWQLELTPTVGKDRQLALVIRSVGPAGGPVTGLSWDGELQVNNTWEITASGEPAVHLGYEGAGDWLTAGSSGNSWQGDDGWGYARLTFHGDETVHVVVSKSPVDLPAGWEIPRLSTELGLDLPDQRFAASLDAQAVHLLMSLVNNETRPGDPVNYPLTWQRDAAYIIVALARAGLTEQARELSYFLAENDFFGGFGSEADAPGLALWALYEAALYLNDPEFEQQMWPHIQRKAGLIEQLLTTEQPYYHDFVGPVVPQLAGDQTAELVADPARDGLIIGRMDHQRPLLYVNAVTFRGLQDAANIAERLGHPAEAERWRAAAEDLQQAWLKAFQTPEADNERTFISSLWPTWVAVPNAAEFQARLLEHWQSRRTSEGEFLERPLWTYFEVAGAHQWLYLDEPERLWMTLNWLWENQTSPGLYTWWEGNSEENTFHQWEKVRGWVAPSYVSPHYWTTAEMLLLQLDMLVQSRPDGAVVVGAGVPDSWLVSPLKAGPILTATGSVTWWWDGEVLTVQIAGEPVDVLPGPAFVDVPLVVAGP